MEQESSVSEGIVAVSLAAVVTLAVVETLAGRVISFVGNRLTVQSGSAAVG